MNLYIVFSFFILMLFLYFLIDIDEKIKRLLNTVVEKHRYLFRIEDDFLNFLSFSIHDDDFENYRIKFIGELDDDSDVMGCQYQVLFSYKIFKTYIEIPVANYYFYYEKSYKNKKEILLCEFQKQKNVQELSYLETLAKKLMMVLIKKALKKKLRDSAR